MSQENLAQPEFTKSYVSAVERGKARPSLKALELMSRRLGIPMSELLAITPAQTGEQDRATREAALAYQLDQANVLINTHQADEALRLLNGAEQEYQDVLGEFSTETRYRFYRLRALAYLHLAEPASARQELNTAQHLAEQLEQGREESERIRNLTGAAFYQQGMPRLALEQHLLGLEAIHAGTVKDLNLRLSIYTNLANDYAALDDTEQALAIYQEAEALLDNVGSLERQAATYWDLSQGYQAAGDLAQARQYACTALSLYEASDNLVTTAQMSLDLAAIRVQQREYEEAERLLERAQTLLTPTGHQLLLSSVHEHYADLELQRGQVDQAEAYAQQSLKLGEAALKPKGGSTVTRTRAARTSARALRISGLAEERRGNLKAADAAFERALALLADADAYETASEIELAYAELLVARGAHEQASSHYRAAFQHRQRHAPR